MKFCKLGLQSPGVLCFMFENVQYFIIFSEQLDPCQNRTAGMPDRGEPK